MTKNELKHYILANRQDKEALEEFRSRPKPNAIVIPANASIEEHLKEAVDQAEKAG